MVITEMTMMLRIENKDMFNIGNQTGIGSPVARFAHRATAIAIRAMMETVMTFGTLISTIGSALHKVMNQSPTPKART